ncbi:hypothetical protein H4R33_006767 [Dimargaris cristalligena]|nr:hypothetical protein H4R33_006767 [Dimargaris cristalligena]
MSSLETSPRPATQRRISNPPYVPQPGLPSGALDTLLKNIKPFTGKPPGPTWDSWKQSLTATIRDYYPQMAPGAQFRLTIALLHDNIRELVIKAGKDTSELFEPFMKTTYPTSLWAEHFDLALHSGTLFKGKNIHVACTIATDAAWQLGGTSHWCIQGNKDLGLPSTDSIVAAVLAAMKGGTPPTNTDGKSKNRRRKDRQAKQIADLRAENARLQQAMNDGPGKA